MKKISILFVILMLTMSLCACGREASKEDSHPQKQANTTEETSEEDDVVKSYESLIESGWEKFECSYKKTEVNEDCEASYIITPKGNTLSLELHYEYGSQNGEVEQVYKEDNSIAPGISASWVSEIYTITGAEIENISYKVYVGNKKVGSGSMSINEALRLALEYDD